MTKNDGIGAIKLPGFEDISWQDEFAPHILARGRKYFEEHRVRYIQRSGDAYIASVAGTENYTIEIFFGEEGIEEMHCTCPYEDHCKHMAAVLFSLESGNVSIEEIPPAKQPQIVSHVPMEASWLTAIEHLSESVIRNELLKRAERDDRLKERLAVLYLGKLPEGQLQNWKADLQEIAVGFADRRGRLQEDDTWDFLNSLSNFLNAKIPLLMEVGATLDTFHLIWIVMETALEWELDDEYDLLDQLFRNCEDAMRMLLPIATDDQREQMQQWYQEHRNKEWPGGVEHMDGVFQLFTQPDALFAGKRIIKYLDQVPCFLHEGDWISFPKRDLLYYDFVEETAAYKEAVPIIEEMIKENLGEKYGQFGSCHAIWRQRKQLLLEKYDIEWFSPAELNRNVCFD